MAETLIECIPNFSEARRPQVVEAIARAVTAVSGISLLDRHSDEDHNRTVLTFIGLPAAVEEAAFQAVKTAAGLIDLNQHSGSHPRIGATDVVPFVPIRGATMEDCIAMARRLGERVGKELGIPVYLYEAAATRPENQNLENIRRGQYEGLRESILTDPGRKPDFGPAELGSAGATVIGARQPLIAYNIYLSSDDASIAKAIARAVRHSSGGLHFVKGLGMLVDGRAQVSMNLTDFHQTPIARVTEMVRREAARHGTGIHHTELVGLIPQQALVDAAVWYLQMDDFKDDQVLENRLLAPAAGSGGEAFLEALAAGSATPGGGAAAAYLGAMAAALVAMVARLTIGKKKYEQVEEKMKAVLSSAEALRVSLNSCVQADSAAFEQVMAAFRLPRETSDQQAARNAAVQEATLQAARVPLEVCEQAAEVAGLAGEAVRLGNLNAVTDAASAAASAQAAFRCAAYNIRTNLAGLDDKRKAAALSRQLARLEEKAAAAEAAVKAALQERAPAVLG